MQQSKGIEAAREWVMTGKGKKEMDDIRKLIADMREEEVSLLKERTDEALASTNNTRMVIIGGTLGAFVLACVAGFIITRGISVPLKEITEAAQRMAAGDLSVKIAANQRSDEVGVLAQAFAVMTESLQSMARAARKIAEGDLRAKVVPQSEKDVLGNAFALMVENLQRVTSQITEGVNVLSSSAGEISTSTTQLAAGAAETASAVSQATTTVEEVRQNRCWLSSQKAKSVSETATKDGPNLPGGQQIDGGDRCRHGASPSTSGIHRRQHGASSANRAKPSDRSSPPWRTWRPNQSSGG